MHAQLTYKENEKKILQTHFVVLFSCVVVLLRVWKARLIYESKLTNSKQPTSEDTSFPGLFFTKSEGKQQVCYLKGH